MLINVNNITHSTVTSRSNAYPDVGKYVIYNKAKFYVFFVNKESNEHKSENFRKTSPYYIKCYRREYCSKLLLRSPKTKLLGKTSWKEISKPKVLLFWPSNLYITISTYMYSFLLKSLKTVT